MARLKSKWNLKDRGRTPEQIASAFSANIWLLAGEGCLQLENEGFETSTHAQRLDVIEEFVAFALHMVDRMSFGELEESERVRFINALGLQLANLVQDNRIDANGPGEYRKGFIDRLNERMDDYSDYNYSSEEGPAFSLKRSFANHVMQVMGERDRKWIPDYVMDVEVPKVMAGLRRVMSGMESSLESADFDLPSIPRDGVWGEG